MVKMNVEEEIARLFAEQDKPKVKLSGGIDFDEQGKPVGCHIDFNYNEKDTDGDEKPASV